MENKEKQENSTVRLTCKDCVYYLCRYCEWHQYLVGSDFIPCDVFIQKDGERND